jgi:hypothetical protein
MSGDGLTGTTTTAARDRSSDLTAATKEQPRLGHAHAVTLPDSSAPRPEDSRPGRTAPAHPNWSVQKTCVPASIRFPHVSPNVSYSEPTADSWYSVSHAAQSSAAQASHSASSAGSSP